MRIRSACGSTAIEEIPEVRASSLGGDGLVREIELLGPAQVTLLTERRTFAPYGLYGGAEGSKGRNVLIENGMETPLAGKCNLHVGAGAVLRIETPGGGGWGSTKDSTERGEQT